MDIRKKTCLIIKKNGHYLAGRIIFSTDLRWSIYRHEAVRTRDIDKAKDPNDPFRLMGFGHRIYKSYDPRAVVLKNIADKLIKEYKGSDPLFDLAQDPLQLHNLYGEPGMEAVTEELRAELHRLQALYEDPIEQRL